MTMSGDSSRTCGCEGWWEQAWMGRQPMTGLTMAFDGRRIRGSGIDVIGRFTLDGLIDERGGVAMIKRYLAAHSVDYLGTYDGEGTMFGEWRIGPDHGGWLITIRRVQAAAEAEIAEIG
jgi:hypothetical protein